jgi:hypothetical protein
LTRTDLLDRLVVALGDNGLTGTAFRKTRSNSSSVASAPISSARSMNRRDCSLSGLGFLGIDRFAVSEPLADDTTDQPVGSLFVADPKTNAGVIAEIELGKVAVQVSLAAMLVDADQPALEHRKEALKGVGMHVAARPFAFRVIDEFMFGGQREALVMHRAVCQQPSAGCDVAIKRRADGVVIEEYRAHSAPPRSTRLRI